MLSLPSRKEESEPRVEPSRTSRVRAADLMGSMSGGVIRNLSGTAGYIKLVSKF